MENRNINRVELQGIVGSCTQTQIAGNTLVRFTVATCLPFVNGSGEKVIETTWHLCLAWNPGADIRKGTTVYLKGRLRNQRYTGDDGQERVTCEILVSSLETREP